MKKLSYLIKKLQIKKSDILLAVGFLFSAPFYAFSWQFMVTEDPTQVFLKPWMIIVCFIITMGCWIFYLILEYKENNVPRNIATLLFFFFAIWSVVGVLIQPTQFSQDVVMRVENEINHATYPGYSVGELVHVALTISNTHKMFFAMASLVITTVFYIMYFVLPKRFKNMNFIIFIAVVTFIFLGIVILYSYITEYDHYIPFLKALFGQGTIEDVYKYSVCSFMVHRVPYGACMMMGLVFAINVHSITKKWYWYLLMAFFYINMIFSYCKTSLIISAILMVIYVIYRLISTYKEHRKRNKIILISLGSVLAGFVFLVGISYVTKGAVLSPLYKMIRSVTETDTIDTRSYIWDNTYQLLQNGWWVIGRGFGTYNEMLYPMNIVNGDTVCPSHSTYNAVLGAGGIVSLLGFLALLGYSTYLFTKCYKKNKDMAISLSFGALAFLMYSFTEGVNYLICVFLFPLFVLHQVTKEK